MIPDSHPGPNDVPAALLAVDALLDGQPVEKEVLRAALGDPAARDYLIDALLLRQLTNDMNPGHIIVAAAPSASPSHRLRWLAATVILALGAGGGFAYGQRSAADVQPSTAEVAVDVTPAAPAPTRTIHFEPGVNWTDQAGSR